jgi:capsular exopolysaccharide synthesis family protein
MTPPFIKRYWIALGRHKWAGIAGFLVVAGLSSAAAVLQRPPAATYITEGVLTYGAPPDIFSATGSALQQQGQAVTKEMLLSNQVINAALKQLEAEEIRLSEYTLLSRTKVTVTGNGQDTAAPAETTEGEALRIAVIYQDGSKDRSQTVTDLLMKAMIDQSRQFNTQQLRRVIENLNQLLPKVAEELRSAEQQLETYVRREGTAIEAAESGSLLTAITSTQQQQRQIRLALTGMTAQIRGLQTRLGMTTEEAYYASALSADPILADLRVRLYQAESQQALFAKTLRPDHPTMLDLQSQLEVYEQQLQARVREVVGGNSVAASVSHGSASGEKMTPQRIRQASSLDPARQALADTLVGLATQQQTLQQQLKDLVRSEQALRQEYSSIPNKQLEQQRLQQQVALKQAFYNQVQARLADAKLAQEETVGSLVVAEEPQTEEIKEPSLSSTTIIVLGGFVAVLVGGGLVMLMGMMDPTFYIEEDIQAALRQQEVPILGILPLLPEEDECLPVLEADSPYLDCYERLRTNLKRIGSDPEIKVVLITSTLSGEGKTVTAYNLAVAAARAGKKTLLIEADLRSLSQAAALHLQPADKRFAQPTHYYRQLDRCIQAVPSIDRLFIVPNLAPQRQSAAVLESDEMQHLIKTAREQFDWVILDTPALSRSSDALLLEPLSDGILLVARPGITEEGLLNETTQQFLESEEIQFLGAMINGADITVSELELDPEPEEELVETAYPEAA